MDDEDFSSWTTDQLVHQQQVESNRSDTDWSRLAAINLELITRAAPPLHVAQRLFTQSLFPDIADEWDRWQDEIGDIDRFDTHEDN